MWAGGLQVVQVGDRVKIRSHHDVWMMGDRYGTIEKIGRKYIHVFMDTSRMTRKFTESDIILLW